MHKLVNTWWCGHIYKVKKFVKIRGGETGLEVLPRWHHHP
jgi:hypothetical protein